MAEPVAAAAPPDPAAQLEALKAKTTKWKSVVKAQLDEAAAKNEKLREQLETANARSDAVAAEVRLQLTHEFKERTQAKDAETERLTAAVREATAATRAAEEAATEALAARDSQHAAQMKQAADAAAASAEAREEQLKTLHAAELERAERKLDTARAEIRDAVQRATAAEEQVAQSRTQAESTEGAATAEVQSLRRQLQEAQTELANQRQRLAAEASRNEQSTQQLIERSQAQMRAELARRDEQMHVAQAMLNQARDELTVTVQRAQRIRSECDVKVEAAERRAAMMTSELASKADKAATLQAEVADLSRTNKQLTEGLDAARAEAASREAAFNDLFEREHEREVARSSGGDPSAKNEQARLAARVAELEALVEELRGKEAVANNRADAAARDVEERSRAVAAREAQLAELDRRVQEKQQRVASEAQRIAESTQRGPGGGGGGGPSSSRQAGDADEPGQGGSWAGALKVDPFVAQLRAGRLMVQTQTAQLVARGRRVWPLVVAVALLLVLFTLGGSGQVAGATPASKKASVDAFSDLQRRYSLTVDQLVACESAATAAGVTFTTKPTASQP